MTTKRRVKKYMNRYKKRCVRDYICCAPGGGSLVCDEEEGSQWKSLESSMNYPPKVTKKMSPKMVQLKWNNPVPPERFWIDELCKIKGPPLGWEDYPIVE